MKENHIFKTEFLQNISLTKDIIDQGKIICGDTLSSLQKIENDIVDLTITSPPYNKRETQKENKKGLLKKNVHYDTYNDNLPEDKYQLNQIEVLDEIYRITIPGGSLFYNHKIRWNKGELFHPVDWLRKSKWHLKQEIVWDRMIAANIRGWRFWQVEERIYWLYKPKDNNLLGKELNSNHAKLTSVWREKPESSKKNSHPAPFPLWLPTRIILSLLDKEKSKIILDPYLGSGTTAVAASLLEQKYIGIEISENYIRQAVERLHNCSNELTELRKELILHTKNNSRKYKSNKNDEEIENKKVIQSTFL